MVIVYSLTEDDFLQHQLFIASKSERIRYKRIKSWAIVVLASVAVAAIFFRQGHRFLNYFSLLFVACTIFFYPLYLRNHYKKHYQNFIAEAYKDRVGIDTTITFSTTQIQLSDRGGESRIYLSELSGINETAEHFFVRMKMGESIVIPKRKIDNWQSLKTELIKIAHSLNVDFTSELDWKWK